MESDPGGRHGRDRPGKRDLLDSDAGDGVGGIGVSREWAGWLRGLGVLQLAVVGLTLRRTGRSTALLVSGRVLVVPVLAAAIRTQPMAVAALLVMMAIGWCRYLDGKEREAAEARRARAASARKLIAHAARAVLS